MDARFQTFIQRRPVAGLLLPKMAADTDGIDVDRSTRREDAAVDIRSGAEEIESAIVTEIDANVLVDGEIARRRVAVDAGSSTVEIDDRKRPAVEVTRRQHMIVSSRAPRLLRDGNAAAGIDRIGAGARIETVAHVERGAAWPLTPNACDIFDRRVVRRFALILTDHDISDDIAFE